MYYQLRTPQTKQSELRNSWSTYLKVLSPRRLGNCPACTKFTIQIVPGSSQYLIDQILGKHAITVSDLGINWKRSRVRLSSCDHVTLWKLNHSFWKWKCDLTQKRWRIFLFPLKYFAFRYLSKKLLWVANNN